MNMDIVKKIGFILLFFIIGGLVGYYSMPAKVTIKTEVVEKIVEKIVEVKVESKKENIAKNTIITKETKKDGTIIEKTEIKDIINNETKTEDKKESIKDSEKIAKSETIKENLSKWRGSIYYIPIQSGSIQAYDIKNIGVGLDRQIIGPIYMGVQAYINKTIGLSIGLNF